VGAFALAGPMSPLCRLGVLGLSLLASSGGGCTLVKPLAGAVVGPVYMVGALGHGGGWRGCGCDDGRALCALFTVGAVIGAGAGLVTGVVSDVQAMRGVARDPTANWWDPFATNTSGR
jgi:hypothetical protein